MNKDREKVYLKGEGGVWSFWWGRDRKNDGSRWIVWL